MNRIVIMLLAATVGALAQGEHKPPAAVECTPRSVRLHEGGTSQVVCEAQVSELPLSQVIVPHAAIPESIQIVDDGKPIEAFRLERDVEVTEQAPGAPDSREEGEASAPRKRNILKWRATRSVERKVTISWLAKGLGWQPRYKLSLGGDGKVRLSLSAVVSDSEISLPGVAVRLMYAPEGGPDGSTSASPKTVHAQAALLAAQYWEPEPPTGSVSPLHEIAVPTPQDLATNGVTVIALWSDVEVQAQEIACWITSSEGSPACVWRIANPREEALPKGRVEVYRDGNFLAEDEIRFTAPGRHACVCVTDASEIAAQKKLLSAEASPLDDAHRDYKWHQRFALGARNLGRSDAHLLVLDPSLRDPLKLARDPSPDLDDGAWQVWRLTIPPGKEKDISEEFYSYHLYK